ncbi:MAG: pyridoxal kinase [Pseudomonadota bacterium]|nr:pyridoxal kinase [Pseudomonadota bacterium]
MSVLTIQSRVASGYVGNSAAVPALQALGVEAVAVDTAHLSNHPGHQSFEGGPAATVKVDALLKGVEQKHAKAGFNAAITGYLGTLATGNAALNAVRRLKSSGRCGFYCLDPVSGDNGRVYVDEELVAFFREQALPAADLIVPNAFEAALLLKTSLPTMDSAPAALECLLRFGPKRAAITGIETPDGFATIIGGKDGLWRIETECIEGAASGAGDAFAALLVGHLVNGKSFPKAVATALASIRDILALTQQLGKSDLAVVEGFGLLRQPKTRYKPIRITR